MSTNSFNLSDGSWRRSFASSVEFIFFFVHYVFVMWNLRNRRRIVPKIDATDPLDSLLLIPAVEAAEKIRSQKITAVQLLDAYIRRAELVNPQLNAIVQRDYERARSEAKKVDEYVLSLNHDSQEFKELLIKKPLLGVPLSVKDHVSVKGLRVTVGLPCFAKNPVCEEDAVLIQRFREAGAIPFLVMWIETENTIYGRTNNPYDSRKAVGGSSGGEGALLGAGATIIGIGSDIGGSIRVPSMFNGVFGYQAQMVGIGPMCRYAKDLMPTLKIFVDPEHHDRLRLNESVDVKNLRVFYMEGSNSFALSPYASDVKEALSKATDHFQQNLDISTIRVSLPLADLCLDFWFAGLCEKGAMPLPNFFTGFNPEKGLNGLQEIPTYLSGKSQHTLPRIKLREILRKQFIDLLKDNGVLIYPSFPQSSYYHNELLGAFTDMQCTSLWNALALPVIAVPMGLNSIGMPTAVQVVAAPENERLLIAVAQELERVYGVQRSMAANSQRLMPKPYDRPIALLKDVTQQKQRFHCEISSLSEDDIQQFSIGFNIIHLTRNRCYNEHEDHYSYCLVDKHILELVGREPELWAERFASIVMVGESKDPARRLHAHLQKEQLDNIDVGMLVISRSLLPIAMPVILRWI
ncbi:Amidase domain-containing protein [Aphelenchoides besseyi]|nr:Amidase domain-containing protein [Aphelenchoides besseyi]